jgi:hypothetical protein
MALRRRVRRGSAGGANKQKFMEHAKKSTLAPGATDAIRRSVEVDAYARASLVAEARSIADAGWPHLKQHQVLRVMLMRAARCRCAAPHQAEVASSGAL